MNTEDEIKQVRRVESAAYANHGATDERQSRQRARVMGLMAKQCHALAPNITLKQSSCPLDVLWDVILPDEDTSIAYLQMVPVEQTSFCYLQNDGRIAELDPSGCGQSCIIEARQTWDTIRCGPLAASPTVKLRLPEGHVLTEQAQEMAQEVVALCIKGLWKQLHKKRRVYSRFFHGSGC